MNVNELSVIEQRVESLNTRIDELLAKLVQVKQTLDSIVLTFDEKLPSQEEMNEYAGQCGTIPQILQSAARDWDDLPTIDDMREMAQVAGEIAAGLQAAD